MNQESENLDRRVELILGRIRRKAAWILVGGLIFYLGGCALLDIFLPAVADKWAARLFAAILIFWGVKEMWPCMRGAFEVGLDSHRSMTPVMRELSGMAKDFRKTTDQYAADGDQVRSFFKELTSEVRKMRQDFKRSLGHDFEWKPPDVASLPDPLLDRGRINGKKVDPKAETRVMPVVPPTAKISADVCTSPDEDFTEGT